MALLLVIAYIAGGYWAVGKTIWANMIIIGAAMGSNSIFVQRCCLGAVLGWILIPVAIIKSLMGR